MQTIETEARVAADGTITVPVGAAEVGRHVKVVITPVAPGSGQINGLPREEWFALLRQTRGGIDDPAFERPPQSPLEARAHFD